MTPAVFLDRDGTLIHEVGYLSRREDLRWFPWAIDAVRLLGLAGFRVFVTTNQGGVALGYYPETFVRSLHEEMDAAVRAAGGRVDGWLYCPHHPQASDPAARIDCECRKPKPGLINQARARHEIDLARSFVIGDRRTDVQMAEAVGARGILVRTGYGEEQLARHGANLPAGTRVVANLAEAVAWILQDAAGAEVS